MLKHPMLKYLKEEGPNGPRLPLILCPGCGAEYDVTLFSFERELRCSCGATVDLARGHTLPMSGPEEPDEQEREPDEQD